jgi:hypothetical protein
MDTLPDWPFGSRSSQLARSLGYSTANCGRARRWSLSRDVSQQATNWSASQSDAAERGVDRSGAT